MTFLKHDIEILNKIYKVVDMGIIGIEEIIKKVDDSCLEKTLIDQKKEYLVIRSDTRKLLDKYEEDPKKVGKVTKLSSEIYTNMVLLTNDNDEQIAKMMLKEVNKGLIEITTIRNERKYQSEEVDKIILHILKIMEYNEKELKKYL